MTKNAKDFMQEVWKLRNEGADTEEKLVAGILDLAAEKCRFYHAQVEEGKIIYVIDRDTIFKLSEEIKNLP